MENKEISMLDILIETHIGLERQGPGSAEMTLKALSFIENLDENSRLLDLGCGTGGQTMVLAQHTAGSVIGIDQFSEFITVFNENVKKLNLQNRAKGIVGNIEKLEEIKASSFSSSSKFDVIWCEGVIDGIGVEKALSHWNGFIKDSGYISLTCPSWLTDNHPDEVEKFWSDAGCRLDTIEYNTSIMQKCGYNLITVFTLPDECWIDNYFIPKTSAEKAVMEKYVGNEIVEEYIKSSKYEVELYSKYKQYYGYVFYIGKKM